MSATDDDAQGGGLRDVLATHDLAQHYHGFVKHGKCKTAEDLITMSARAIEKVIVSDEDRGKFERLQKDVEAAVQTEDEALAAKSPPVATIVAIGPTGTGKSSALNMFANKRISIASGSGASVTQHTRCRVVKRTPDAKTVRYIDTPGLGESEGKDAQHIASIAACLKEVDKVDLFLLVSKSDDARFQTILAAMDVLKRMIGDGFLKNTLVLQTAWKMDERSVAERKDRGVSKETRREEIQKWFADKFEHPSVPVEFVDSVPNPRARERQQRDADTATAKLVEMAQQMPDGPYSCAKAKSVRTALAEEQAKLERERVQARQRAQAEAAARRYREQERQRVEAQRRREREEQERREREERERYEREREQQRRRRREREEEEERRQSRRRRQIRRLLQDPRVQHMLWLEQNGFY